MPKLIFEAETQAELVAQVKRWLVSNEADADGALSITKDALRIIAASAPKPVAQNDLVKGLAEMGYRATDATSQALVQGLGTVESISGGKVLRVVGDKGRSAVYQMNMAVAKQVLKTLHGA